MNDINISVEITPNPNTLRFMLDKELLTKGSIDYNNAEKAENCILPKNLFKIGNITNVFIGKNFISITKSTETDWTNIIESITTTIKSTIKENESLFNEELLKESNNNDNDTETTLKIKEILDTEIRPAVAMDGGDIIFDKYEDNILYLQLQGACSGCPSSTMTLKMGIENRLKEDIPDLEDVIQI